MSVPPGRRRGLSSPRKRYSPSRLSSDTTLTLPEYTDARIGSLSRDWIAESGHPSISELPPDYPESAEEADEETDDFLPAPIQLSPRRLRRIRSVARANKHKSLYSGKAGAQSDTYLDSLLERSVNALELSNTLLQSSMSTQSSLSNILSSPNTADASLENRARLLNTRIKGNKDVHEGWLDDLDDLAKGIDGASHDEVDIEKTVSQSLPTTGLALPHRRKYSRRDSVGSNRGLAEPQRSPAATQNVFIRPATRRSSVDDATNPTLDLSNPYGKPNFRPPSTRSSSTVSARLPSIRQIDSPISSAYVAFHYLTELNADWNHRPSSRSGSPNPEDRYQGSPLKRSLKSRSRSRSWSRTSNHSPAPPISRNIPTPIAELPSNSDSSSSSNSLAVHAVESLRKILEDTVPEDAKGKAPLYPRSPTFLPRSPAVVPVLGTSTTTTSITRMLKKGSHSTSTRAPSPPKHSSLKRPPSELLTVNLNMHAGLISPYSSGISSGRSTPRQVAFGPLPEPYSSSKEGGSSKLSMMKRRGRSKTKQKPRENESDRSWWKTWLLGGSELSMAPDRHEERAEERFGRSWGRPAMGGGLEDWGI